MIIMVFLFLFLIFKAQLQKIKLFGLKSQDKIFSKFKKFKRESLKILEKTKDLTSKEIIDKNKYNYN